MALVIKQANYTKKPTTMQRSLLRYLGVTPAPTRIEAHLQIARIKTLSIVGANKIKTWKRILKMRKALRRNGDRTASLTYILPGCQEEINA